MSLLKLLSNIGLVGLLLGISLVASAGPEEDMAAGRLAYERGDVVDAITNFTRAARQDHIPAQLWLGEIYDQSEQNADAVYWYRRAADLGSAEGQFNVGRMYLQGDGVEQNNEQAVTWITTAAENGFVPAMRVLATNFQQGGLGLAADPEQARLWLQKAAELGDAWAKDQLNASVSNQ